MQNEIEFSVKGEQCWQELKTHFEWADAFELFFLFTDNPQISNLLRQRIGQLFQSPIVLFQPSQPASLISDVLEFLTPLENQQLSPQQRSPIWLECSQYSLPQQPSANNKTNAKDSWAAQQASLLARINERRDRLRKHHPRPFVIVMHGDFAQQVRAIAPDLWSVRCASLMLSQDFIITPPAIDKSQFKSLSETNLQTAQQSLADIMQHPKVVEWQRLSTKNAQGLDMFGAGYAAFVLLQEAGYYQQAQPIAEQLHHMATTQVIANGDDNDWLRALSITFECKGDSAQSSGDLTTALARSSESLTIRRQLQQQLGEQPQVLRDIAISLEKVADANQSLGNNSQALAQYNESLAIRYQLQQLLGDQPQVLCDLSEILARLAYLEQQMGHLKQAKAHYQQCLSIRQNIPEVSIANPELEHWVNVAKKQLDELRRLG